MTGPCLCGDPYCPRCGNPERAAAEEAEERLLDELGELDMAVDEYELLRKIAPNIIEAFREYCNNRVVNAIQNEKMEIQALKQEIVNLRQRLGEE
jgi:hypothetical protein